MVAKTILMLIIGEDQQLVSLAKMPSARFERLIVSSEGVQEGISEEGEGSSVTANHYGKDGGHNTYLQREPLTHAARLSRKVLKSSSRADHII
jgi:hypothetical protein